MLYICIAKIRYNFLNSDFLFPLCLKFYIGLHGKFFKLKKKIRIHVSTKPP